MDCISSRYRKPKGRPSKRKKASIMNIAKRWNDSSSVEVTDKDNNDDIVSSSGESPVVPNYLVIDKEIFSSLLCDVCCPECKTQNLNISTGHTYGFSTKIILQCKQCDYKSNSSYSSSRQSVSRRFDINNKFVKGFLSIGKGHSALETFSMILGIPAMDRRTFASCLDQLSSKCAESKQYILQTSHNAVRKKHLEMDASLSDNDIIDICVSFDGTWQKRGHTSLYGIGIAIDIMTGLVVDFEIMSKYCPECIAAVRDLGNDTAEYHIWSSSHSSECQKNFSGSSNSMEMHAASILWKRSIKVAKMRYTSMLSDGDSKTFLFLNEQKVYGHTPIMKEECINHVSKRLGTGIRNKIKECKAKGVTLGGKKRGNLTEGTIIKLQNYYRKAIKDNAPDIDKMKTAALASLYHCMSTDDKPQHSKCPEGSTSWCFYQRAIALKEPPKTHSSMKTVLSQRVVSEILPVYQRLLSTELLSRCISAKTQNANESLHSCIWSKCPKEVFVSKKRLELSVISAVGEFNLGCAATLQINNCEVENSRAIAEKRDKRRSSQKNVRSSDAYKHNRNLKKFKNSINIAKKIKKEGVSYGAGKF